MENKTNDSLKNYFLRVELYISSLILNFHNFSVSHNNLTCSFCHYPISVFYIIVENYSSVSLPNHNLTFTVLFSNYSFINFLIFPLFGYPYSFRFLTNRVIENIYKFKYLRYYFRNFIYLFFCDKIFSLQKYRKN